MNPGRPRLAACVALAYTLVIVYASVQPFGGWRMPAAEAFAFLSAPLPRFITASDIVLNVVAYLPLGALLTVALRTRLGAGAAAATAVALAAGLSLALEHVQLFLPSRIASNLDLAANAGGATAGALAAWLCALPALADNPLSRLRRQSMRNDTAGDCGLIVLAVWLFVQFDPAPLALASGDLREALDARPWLSFSPGLYRSAEAAVAALAVIVLGLLAAQLTTGPRSAFAAATAALGLTFVVKSFAVWSLGRAAVPTQWLTPGVTSGIAAGAALLLALLWLPRAWRSAAAIACVLAALATVNLTPENPYQNAPPYLLAAQRTHLSNFSNIVHLLSQLWPFATALLLVALARHERGAARAA